MGRNRSLKRSLVTSGLALAFLTPLSCASIPEKQPEVVVAHQRALVQGCVSKGLIRYSREQIEGSRIRVPELANRAAKLGGNVLLTLATDPTSYPFDYAQAEVLFCKALPSPGESSPK